MELKETARIVRRVCAIDRREGSDLLIATWHEIIGHMPYDEAVAALKIVASESVDTIKPGHLLRARPAARAEIDRAQRRAERQRALDNGGREQRKALVAADVAALAEGFDA
jgi:hypothetical protein